MVIHIYFVCCKGTPTKAGESRHHPGRTDPASEVVRLRPPRILPPSLGVGEGEGQLPTQPHDSPVPARDAPHLSRDAPVRYRHRPTTAAPVLLAPALDSDGYRDDALHGPGAERRHDDRRRAALSERRAVGRAV